MMTNHVSLSEVPTLKAVVMEALHFIGLNELSLKGVFSAHCNLISSERGEQGDVVFILLTDDTYITLHLGEE